VTNWGQFKKKREMGKNKEIGGSLVAIFKRICAKCIDKVDQKGWKDVPKRYLKTFSIEKPFSVAQSKPNAKHVFRFNLYLMENLTAYEIIFQF